jgi:DNA repair protein RecO (recombination protein O)
VENTAAILLRKTRFSDTSLIVTWFTNEHGRLKTVVKGALRPKSRFSGVLDLFFECEIAFARSTKSEVHTLREAVLREPRENMRTDFPRVALGSYFVELIEYATEPEQPAPELFDLLQRAFAHLDKAAATRRAMLHFEKELVRFLGIEHPNLTAIISLGRAIQRIPATRPSLLASLP